MRERGWLSVIMVIVAVVALFAWLPAKPALAQGTWYAEYFANRDLTGGPVLTRYENQLSFDWGGGSPGQGVPSDSFSARWTRSEWFEAGTYRFSYRSDDGVRIWVDGTLVVDDWRDRQGYWSSIDRFISRGSHSVRVEYFEHTGGALLQASWERITGGAGWRGEYFKNRDLAGSPIIVRSDAAVDFDWGVVSPDSAVPADNFSVRWTRSLGFTGGTYRFLASCDDGVRVFVDGIAVIDQWHDQKQPNTRSGDLALSDGQHSIVVEYYEHGGDASAHVWWNKLGSIAGWEGRYYDNPDLRGGPAMIRDDPAIDFDWGEAAPASWMPSDSFSAVWTRNITFAPGYYRFNVRSDDGVRVWLDGGIFMDYWFSQEFPLRYVNGTYLEGTHTLKVEYFERAGLARIKFWWEPAGGAPTPVPPTLAPSPPPALPGPWRAEYFNGQGLTGNPVLVRTDSTVDFNWGWQSPAAGVNANYFSVRWTGQIPFESGRYRFTTTTDDGVRLYVDDRLVISSWRGMRGTRVGYATVNQGTHTVRVEYFEQTQAAMARVGWQQVGSTTAQPQPTLLPALCAGGPIQLKAWPVDTWCAAGGWTATVYVQASGGDCRYTYAWERQVKSGPTGGQTTFDLHSTVFGAMVGEASVTSGGQVAKVGLYIRPPESCKK